MKLKPLLFLAGGAGAAAAVVKRRGGAQAIPDAVQNVASSAPEPIRQAAQTVTDTVQSAVQSVTPGGGDDQPQERYQPPIEGLAQEPRTSGTPPSSDAASPQAPPIATDPDFQLNEPEHGPPEGSVMPDTSDDDPLVRQQEKAAAGDAGSIGGNVNDLAADD